MEGKELEEHLRHEYLFKKGLNGELTKDEEYEYYTKYMNGIERVMKKPLYEMNNDEWKEYLMREYNIQDGHTTNPTCRICAGKGFYKKIFDGYLLTVKCNCMK